VPGHLSGGALVDAEQYLADGLLSPDGELRLHIYKEIDGGVASAVQLVATVTTAGSRASGTGSVIGQRCSSPLASRFCGIATPARIDLIGLYGPDPTSRGEITITTAARTEIWWLRLGYWGGRPPQATSFPLATTRGHYRETLAEFAAADAVIINLDAGRFFFQSSDTGCVGNGTLSAPYADLPILRAELTIDGCIGARMPLNAQFVGLAIFEAITPYDFEPWGPKLWLSASGGSPVGLTTFAAAL
jgi:hypothetical protein